MGTIFIRTIIIYSFVLIAIRLMGKREIGQLQPYELVVTIMIADVASLPMQNVSIPLFQGIVPILGLLFSQIVVSLLTFNNKHLNKWISGKPTVLMAKGQILEENMKKQRYSIESMLEQLRVAGYQSLLDVDYVILETSGEISVIPKAEQKQVTVNDMNLKINYTGYTRTIILNGEVNDSNLLALGKDRNWLQKELKKYHLTVDNTMILTVNEKNQVYCQGLEG